MEQKFPEINKLSFSIPKLGSAVDIKQITKNNEISKGSPQQFLDLQTNEISSDHVEDNMQKEFDLQLEQCQEGVNFYIFHDSVADYLESMSKIDIKQFMLRECCLRHRLHFSMHWIISVFQPRSRLQSLNKFLE